MRGFKTAARIVTVTVLIGTLLTGCGDPPMMTIDEYAAFCGPLSAKYDTEAFIKWGDWQQMVDDFLVQYSEIEPPDTLAVYHATNLRAMATLQAALKDYDADTVFGEWDLLGPFLLAQGAFDKATEAQDALPPEIRQPLVDAGCILEDSEDSGGS